MKESQKQWNEDHDYVEENQDKDEAEKDEKLE